MQKENNLQFDTYEEANGCMRKSAKSENSNDRK